MWRLGVLALALAASPAQARDQYFERSGAIYDVTADANGMTLTSTSDLMLMPYPAAEGASRSSDWFVGRQTFHIGFDCEVGNDIMGEGKLANGSGSAAGFRLIFADGLIVYDFPNQEPYASGRPFDQCYETVESVPATVTYVSSDGDEYTATENDSGGVLTSLYPKSRVVGSGAKTQWQKGPDILYFGKDCDAFSTYWGKGSFGWANGGFLIKFGSGKEIGFPRQDLPWEKLAHCELK